MVGWPHYLTSNVIERRVGRSDRDDDEAERLARQHHAARQREGHRTPDWDDLPELMRVELIYRTTETKFG